MKKTLEKTYILSQSDDDFLFFVSLVCDAQKKTSYILRQVRQVEIMYKYLINRLYTLTHKY
jgi:hypothetical protein